MLSMIKEEPEGRAASNDGMETNSISSAQKRNQNYTFPRRATRAAHNVQPVDWGELLAKATEADMKSKIDLNDIIENEDSSNEDLENMPSFTNPVKSTGNEMVLDLSSVKKNIGTRKGYTLPSFDQKYTEQRNQFLSTPLKEVNNIVSSLSVQKVAPDNVDREKPECKRQLMSSKAFYYEREVVTHMHTAIHQPNNVDNQKPLPVNSGPKVQISQKINERYEPAPVAAVPSAMERPVVRHEEAHFGSQRQSMSNHQQQEMQPPLSHPSRQPSNVQKPQPTNQGFAVPNRPTKPRGTGKELVVNGNPYEILTLLGKGGSSKVYLVFGRDNSLLAVKCVNLANVDKKLKMDHINEIEHLLKMQHCKNIIKIIDHQYIPHSQLLFTVMERGDTDLARLLKERTNSGEGIPPEMILFYWSEILLAVKSIHDNNIIHRDLKPANFLLVKGRLKLIDFGIASAIQSEQTSVFKDSPTGTPNYMSPEACEDMGIGEQGMVKIGRKTDVWSLGCILYSFLYGKTPFQEYSNALAKFRAITNPNHSIPFPPVPGVPQLLIESCRRCLIYDKNQRASIEELLELKNKILLTTSNVLDAIRPVLDEVSYEKAKTAIVNSNN